MQINSNVNVRDFPQLTKALESFMENNNIHKDSAVLEKFLSDYSLTLETPKEEKPIEKIEKPQNDIDRSDLDKWVKDLNLKNLG
jgi:hypothetical protein